jgi:hypothetical protein
MSTRHHLRCFLRRLPRTSSARDGCSVPIRDDLAAVRSLSPALYRQVVLQRSLPRYTLYIRFTTIAAATVLSIIAVLLARLDFGIEALLLLVLLAFPAFVRFLAVMLYRTTEGLVSLYHRIHPTRHREPPEGVPMKFSLINITESHGSLVSGYWLQNHVGSLASAREVARATEATNGNKITVAVVPELSSTTPALSYWRDLTRLDIDP